MLYIKEVTKNRNFYISAVTISVIPILIALINYWYISPFPSYMYGDASTYWGLAERLYNSGIYTETWLEEERFRAWRPPGYPFFLSLIIGLGIPKSLLPIVQSLLLLSASLFICDVCLDIYESRTTLILACVLMTSNPHVTKMVMTSMSEILSIFLTTVSIWSIFKSYESDYYYVHYGLLSGAFLGFSVLTRTPAFSILIVYTSFAAYFCFCYNRKKFISFLSASVLCTVIIFAWMCRNYVVLGGIVMINSASSFNMYMGSIPNVANDGWKEIHDNLINPLRREYGEVGTSKRLRSMFLDRILNQPIEYAKLKIDHFIRNSFLHPNKALGFLSTAWVPLSAYIKYKSLNNIRVLLLFISTMFFWLLISIPFYKPRWVVSMYPLVVSLSCPALSYIVDSTIGKYFSLQ